MNDVAMPPRIRSLGRDARGYPIPWNVLRGKDGTPVFTTNDSQKHMKAIQESLCPICGQRLGKYKWFVGGPRSAFDPDGWYVDLPGHKECIEYALQVCPWLAVKNYHHRVDMIEKAKRAAPEGAILVDQTQDPERPLCFVAVASETYEMRINEGALPYVRPWPPWLGVQYWRDGRRIADQSGEEIVRLLGLKPGLRL